MLMESYIRRKTFEAELTAVASTKLIMGSLGGDLTNTGKQVNFITPEEGLSLLGVDA